MRVRVSDDLVIDFGEFAEEGVRVAIMAASGYGKSNLAALFAEEAIEQGMQVVVIEPVSEFHTLKALYQNVVVFGGPYQDAPIDPDAHQLIVDFLDESGASAVVCVEDIEDEMVQKEFVARLLYGIYRRWSKLRRPLLLIIEEADEWAPEIASKESWNSRRKVALIMKRGRKVGIYPILITQRPADIAKSALAQANIIFFGFFKAPQDLSPKTGVMFMAKKLNIPITEADIMSLRPGEFYAWIRDRVQRIKARWRKTPHGGLTPQIEVKPLMPQVEKPLEELRKKLEELIARRREEMDLIKRLQAELEEKDRRIAELEEELKILKAVKEVVRETPLDVKMEVEEVPSSRGVPEVVLRCPYPGAMKIYSFLRNAGDYVGLGEISTMTGISQNVVRKVVRYFRHKGLVKVKTVMRGGRPCMFRVKLRK